MQGGRSQQTMPEDRTGWHRVDAGRAWRSCSTPIDDPVAESRTILCDPQSWLRCRASASRRCASTPSVWAPIFTPGRLPLSPSTRPSFIAAS